MLQRNTANENFFKFQNITNTSCNGMQCNAMRTQGLGEPPCMPRLNDKDVF